MRDDNASGSDLTTALRIALFGGAILIVVAYGIFVPMKLRGILNPNFTWSRIVLGPLLVASFLPTMIFLEKRRPGRTLIHSIVVVILAIAVFLLVSILDPVGVG